MVFSKQQTTPKCKIIMDGEELEQIEHFNYLGSELTTDGRSTKDIRKRIVLAKQAFNNMKSILANKKITIKTKKRFLQIYIWSILLYGCEAWTITKKEQKYLEAAEMWFYRQMLRVSWMDRESNDTVLKRAGTKRSLVDTIRKRQLRFVGHITRERGLEKLCLQGKIEGTKGRGRPRASYMDGLTLATGVDTLGIMRMADNRNGFREVVANVSV